MERRTFVGIVAGVPLLWRIATNAQAPRRIPIIGILFNSSPREQYGALDAFRSGLRDLGYLDGQNIAIDARYADGKLEHLPALAASLVAAGPDMIVAAGPPAARALLGATSKVPIVLAIVTDPVSEGFVTSLSHPGGNLTGLSFQNSELTGKRLQMLREVSPASRRIAVLSDRAMVHAGEAAALGAASALGFAAKVYAVQGAADFAATFQTIQRDKADGLMVLASPMLAANRKVLLEMVAKDRLPATYENRTFVDDGGLMSYGPSFIQMWRQSATYVDKILRGVKPGDLPMEQPTKFELVVNLQAAESLGLTMPQSLLLRADEVIQ